MKLLQEIWDRITEPFIMIAIAIDESRRMDDDRGPWAKHNRKQNERKMRKEEYQNNRRNLK